MDGFRWNFVGRWLRGCGSAWFGYVLSRIRIRVLILDLAQSPDPGSGQYRTYIQNCKPDSAKSNGRISIKLYDWIACESRKTAFNFGSDTDHTPDAVSVSGSYPYYWLRRILTKFGAEIAPTTGKSWVSCRSSRSKIKVKHNKNTSTELSDNDLCRR